MNISEMQLKIKEGDHLCSIYATLEQQYSIIAPFILDGLEKGEKCISILDEHTAENTTSYFLDHGVDLKPFLQSGAFIFLSKEETYLKDGIFCPEQMLDLLKTNLQKALNEGYNGLRATGEMTWVFSRLPGVDRLMEYEAKFNQFVMGMKVSLICQYNENKFEPAVLLDVLRTHPKVILYGNCYDNNYFEPPDIFLALQEGKITRDIYLNALDMIMQYNKINEHKLLQEKLQKGKNEAEQTLHAAGKEYQFLVNNISEAVVVAQDSLYKYANPMAIKLFKCSEDELTTKPFSEFIHPDDRDMVVSRHRKRLKGEDVIKRYPYRIKAADGITKWVEVSSVAIEWDGRPAALALISDITERKKMEEEIIKADKLESIGILAGGIAHDFNNYLAALLGNTSLAKLYTNNPQKVLEKLESIERATLRAQELSNQLFAFAKGAKPVKKTVSLNNFMIESINFTLSGSNIGCDFYIAKNLYLVELDEAQFSQVLNNMVLNAVQAMPEGGTIRVKAENVTIRADSEVSFLPSAAGDYIKISIEDKGIGIPKIQLKKIFDPFFTTKQKGNGLGLATSYTIMQNHGGHISVTSKIGVGTTFHLYLPASTQHHTTTTLADNIFYGSGKILVMDDQEDYLAATGETLFTFGYAVSLARDGREAITIYMDALKKGQPFDLVIMDLTIPGGMGGKETIKELLQNDPQVKAIVASGYSNDLVMASFSEYGFKAAVQKPFTIETLSRVVKEAMG